MAPENLYTWFRARWELDRPFLRVPDGPSLSYGDMDDLSGRMASVLIEREVRPGDRLLVQVDKSVDSVALYLAALRVGAVYLPLNTAYTRDEVAFFASDATPRLAVVEPGRGGELSGVMAGADVLTLGGDGEGTLPVEVESAVTHAGVVGRSPDDMAAMLYTSGTTGRSKGAMLTVENLASNADALHRIWGWRPGDVLLHILPIFHVHGLFVALHCAMLNGSEVIFLPRFDAARAVGELPGATVMMGVPTHYRRLLDEPGFGVEQCRSVRLFTSGSAPMTETLHREFEHRTGHRVLERYGMTEAGMITSNPYDGERVAGTVGFPLPDVEIRVVDDEQRVLGPGELGTVEVRGPNVFAGYWNLPERTATEFRDGGWFSTGDIGSVDDEGRLTLSGRSSDLIISGGLNVYPKEIELCIERCQGVREAAVVGLPHPDLGEAVVAFVVAGSSIEQGDLDRAVEPLARFKRPKVYLTVDELPRNAMGKIQKARLRESHEGLFLEPGGL